MRRSDWYAVAVLALVGILILLALNFLGADAARPCGPVPTGASRPCILCSDTTPPVCKPCLGYGPIRP
jgi:hypothetical protein